MLINKLRAAGYIDSRSKDSFMLLFSKWERGSKTQQPSRMSRANLSTLHTYSDDWLLCNARQKCEALEGNDSSTAALALKPLRHKRLPMGMWTFVAERSPLLSRKCKEHLNLVRFRVSVHVFRKFCKLSE